MKKIFKTSFLFILALFIALSLFLIPPIETTRAIPAMSLPVLTAHIMSPGDGDLVTVGDCFEVKATVRATCSGVISKSLQGWPFVQPVHAVDMKVCFSAAENVSATISVSGNAEVQDCTTNYIGMLTCPDESGYCPSSATVTWKVCCTDTGPVTITVIPYGETHCEARRFTEPPAICDLFMQPVYAVIDWCALPSENLISDSITIHQVFPQQPRENFAKTLFNEGGGNVSSWPKPADNRVTNINIQPRQAAVNQPVTIYANLANRGEAEGPYTATLKINGQEEAVKSGIVQGNTAVPLKFTILKEQPGTYEVDINGQKSYFTIIGEETKPGLFAGNTKLLPLILWGILVIAVITALMIVVVRRRQSSC